MKSPLPKINENFTLLLIERLSTRAAPPADDEVVGRAIFFSPPASANRLVLFPASIHLLSHGNFEIAAFLSTDSRRKKSVESWSGTEEEYIGMDPLSGFSSFFFLFSSTCSPSSFHWHSIGTCCPRSTGAVSFLTLVLLRFDSSLFPPFILPLLIFSSVFVI